MLIVEIILSILIFAALNAFVWITWSKIKTLEQEIKELRQNHITDMSHNLANMERRMSESISKKIDKSDRLYREMENILKDAKEMGEGLFAVKKLEKEDFFAAVKPESVFYRGRS